ncbi:hypothetical protein [Dactylosporangium darangshiense]|uniref:hypothetical protein n=1 Tax=Dactylosporangium darangshiense TaxID=579108 RepID=UPI0031EB325D
MRRLTRGEEHRTSGLDLGAMEEHLAGRLDSGGQAALAGQVAWLIGQPGPPPTPIAGALARIMEHAGGDEGLIAWLDQYPGRPRLVVRILQLVGLLDRFGDQRTVVFALDGLRTDGRFPPLLADRLPPTTDEATLACLAGEIKLMLAGDERTLAHAGRVAHAAAEMLAAIGPGVSRVPGVTDLGELAEASRRDLAEALEDLKVSQAI